MRGIASPPVGRKIVRLCPAGFGISPLHSLSALSAASCPSGACAIEALARSAARMPVAKVVLKVVVISLSVAWRLAGGMTRLSRPTGGSMRVF